jgi:hypothetical protein
VLLGEDHVAQLDAALREQAAGQDEAGGRRGVNVGELPSGQVLQRLDATVGPGDDLPAIGGLLAEHAAGDRKQRLDVIALDVPGQHVGKGVEGGEVGPLGAERLDHRDVAGGNRRLHVKAGIRAVELLRHGALDGLLELRRPLRQALGIHRRHEVHPEGPVSGTHRRVGARPHRQEQTHEHGSHRKHLRGAQDS